MVCIQKEKSALDETDFYLNSRTDIVLGSLAKDPENISSLEGGKGFAQAGRQRQRKKTVCGMGARIGRHLQESFLALRVDRFGRAAGKGMRLVLLDERRAGFFKDHVGADPGIAAFAMALPGVAAAKEARPKAAVERTLSSPTSVISSTAKVPPGSTTLYISGTTPSPPDPAKPDELGDTRAQTLSILTKMKAQLEGMGWSMGDVVKMTVFLVAPTPGGRMDSAAMNDVFKTFFGTAEQPNRPTRSTIQIAALGRPTMYVEIEAIAAKAP